MINRVVLVGRLTKDPELKYTQTGIASTRFTLAVNRAFSNAAGEKEADFINCTAWRKQAENMANFLKKGSLIGVEGRIQTGSYDGQDGKRVFTTEVMADSVQFLEPRRDGQGAAGTPGGSGGANAGYTNPRSPSDEHKAQHPPETYNNPDPFATGGGPIEVSDDDLPF